MEYREGMEYYEGVKLTPLLKQYLEKRNECRGAILLFRLGDFYEMFFEEAILAAKVLGIALTSRSPKPGEKGAPMCGVPFHAAKTYIARLVKAGFNIAICEQISQEEDSKLFKREIVKIITPGTLVDEELLEDSKNNYIMSIYFKKNICIALADITTGVFLAKEVKEKELIDVIAKYNPKEIITEHGFAFSKEVFEIFGVKTTTVEKWYFDLKSAFKVICDFYKLNTLKQFGLEDEDPKIRPLGALIEYLQLTQRQGVFLLPIKILRDDDTMHLDISTLSSLELIENNKGTKKATLLSIIDKTKTPMGGRLLVKWICEPLTNKQKIETRLSHVSLYYNDGPLRMETSEILANIKDIERILARIKDNPLYNITALKLSLRELQKLNSFIELDKLEDILESLENNLDDNALFKEGINELLDEYREIEQNGEGLLLALEVREAEKTNISKLKIKHSKLYGYTFEVTNSQKEKVPEYFIRKQTLTNTERYQTEELLEIEEKIVTASEKISGITKKLTEELVNYVSSAYYRILNSAKKIAYIDVVSSFANVAVQNNYTLPVIKEEGDTKIIDARHPVVEQYLDMGFIPNNALFNDNIKVHCITGPNMSGKSTFMRSIALIHLMAQIGSFVPCKEAEITIVDRIFTRIGASDSLATGQSTFMVEMNEVSNILANMSSNSLIILDEVGRGTSTHDGLSIAWSVLTYIAALGAKTLFSTHYHELSKIEESVEGVKNYRVSIEEVNGKPIFLHKVVEGAAQQSYGITVAKLAGIPTDVIEKAEEMLKTLRS